MSTIHEVFAQVGALEVGELEVASKRLERASSGKKTVRHRRGVVCGKWMCFVSCRCEWPQLVLPCGVCTGGTLTTVRCGCCHAGALCATLRWLRQHLRVLGLF